jgi:undecaprenyl-diphosphatase
MLGRLLELDKDLFMIINSHHNGFWDFVMYWLSNSEIWIPLYLFFIYLIIRKYRWFSLIIIVFAAILITVSDQSSVHLFKNMFIRLRPCHDPGLANLVHLVNGKCGGEYGFVSSHAVNMFALSVFLIHFLGNKVFTPLILIWAAAICYSRVYLGAHYPGDVLCGAIWGSIIGLILARMSLYLYHVYIGKRSRQNNQ